MIQSCFSYCRKVLLVICVFKNVKVRFRAQNYHPVIFFLWLIKSCKNCNRFLDHLEKCGLFSDFQYGFRSSQSTPDLLTGVSDRVARGFNRSGAARAVTLDISKVFCRVWHAGLLHRLKSSGNSGQIFGLISFLSNRRL